MELIKNSEFSRLHELEVLRNNNEANRDEIME